MVVHLYVYAQIWLEFLCLEISHHMITKPMVVKLEMNDLQACYDYAPLSLYIVGGLACLQVSNVQHRVWLFAASTRTCLKSYIMRI